MSPSTVLGSATSTRSIRFWASTVALTGTRLGSVKAIVRPCLVALLASAALTTPCGVIQSWACRSISAIGAGMAASPITFQAWSPLTRKIWRCSPRIGCTPPPRGGSSAWVRTQSSLTDAVS